MYSRGMTTREIEGHLKEMYGVDVSPALISNVTEAVMEEVKTWQSRPLDETYAILYLDALRVKIREGGHVQNRAIYVAIAVNMQGNKEVLGLWAAENEGSKVLAADPDRDIENRGAKDFFIACVDGLKGFPEAIESVYPRTEVQLCIVHLVRASLTYVNWKQRKEVAADLRLIYQAGTVSEAEIQREAFARKWDAAYPMVSQIWLPELGADHSVLCLSRRDPKGHLHDQHDRVTEYVAAQDHQNARVVSKRRRRHETAVLGLAECLEEMDDAGTKLERGVEPIQYSLAGADARVGPSLIAPPEIKGKELY